MATRIEQEYSGPADEVNVNTDYPKYRFEAEIPFNSEINISVSRDTYERLQQRLAYLRLVQGISYER